MCIFHKNKKTIFFKNTFTFNLVGYQKTFYASTAKTEIPKFWDEVMAKHIPGLGEVAVCTELPGSLIRYMIAKRSIDEDDLLDGMIKKEIPNTEYLIFKSVGPVPDAVQKTEDHIFNKFLPKHKEFKIDNFSIEWYSDDNMQSASYRTDILVPLIK